MPGLFDTIGQKAEQLASAPATNGTHEAQLEDDEDQKVVEEIESLCMNCRENARTNPPPRSPGSEHRLILPQGTTRLLLTKIPFFREVIIMSFSCDKCSYQNNEIQPAGTFQLKGAHYGLRLTALPDFERQVVKSDTATVKFIELDVEVPAGRGQLTNVEGLLTNIIDDLESDQEAREEQAPEVYAKIDEIITRAAPCLREMHFPSACMLTILPVGSFIALTLAMVLASGRSASTSATPSRTKLWASPDTATTGLDTDNIIPDQVYQFPASCPGCMHPCVTNMKMVDIPHFQQVVLMNTSCDDCGYKSNDVKTGGEIPEKGRKMTIKVKTAEDLARDILKSDSCALECPELNLSVNPGTLGGRFTTVEGLLTQVRDDLRNQIFEADGSGAGGGGGDSLSSGERERWNSFFEGLDQAINGEKEFTIILTDPLASSYVQRVADDPSQPDPQITVEEYQRTDEEEEELGLSDMKLEGYEQDAKNEED